MVKGKHLGSYSGKASKPKKERNDRKISWHQCLCSGSSQVPNQDDLDNYDQFLSLYKAMQRHGRTELRIYDTEINKEKAKLLDSQIYLDETTCITQLSNGDLFCYGSSNSGITLIIDRNNRVRMLPSGAPCIYSSALCFDSNIYCFGGYNNNVAMALLRKFDLKNNRWVNLTSFPDADLRCHSVIFNGNILVSGYWCKNLWLYSIEINSVSIIPYDFAQNKRKFMINIEMLYLVEWGEDGSIYEGEDEYHWKLISKSGPLLECYHIYCLCNKDKVYISTGLYYYQFDLKEKELLLIE